MQETIAPSRWRRFNTLADRKFANTVRAAAARTQGATGSRKLADLVRESGGVLTAGMVAVDQTLKGDEQYQALASVKSGRQLYSAYIAARLTGELFSGGLIELDKSLSVPYIDPQSNEIARVREALEGLASSVVGHRLSRGLVGDYFNAYADESLRLFAETAPGSAQALAADLEWVFPQGKVSGVHYAEPVPATPAAEAIPARRREGPDLGLQPVTFDPDKVLPRERIIGDHTVIDALEEATRRLFFYDSSESFNAYKAEGLFPQTHILQGPHGTGKSAVAIYAIDRAKRLAEQRGRELYTVDLNVKDSWKNGEIQNVMNQLHAVAESPHMHIIFSDEMDKLLEDHPQRSASGEIIAEVNMFLEGLYPNNGNYLWIGTINDIGSLRPSSASRFRIYHWQGPRDAEEHGAVFRSHLWRDAEQGLVQVSDQEYSSLGALSVEYSLAGRDIAMICSDVRGNALRKGSDTALDAVEALFGNPQAQTALVRRSRGEVTYDMLRGAVEQYRTHRDSAVRSSVGVNRFAS